VQQVGVKFYVRNMVTRKFTTLNLN